MTGQTQLLEITASLAGLEDEGPFDATDPEVVNKFAYCADQATKYVSAQVRGTKFFEYLSCRVLPQLREVEDANRQTGLLKFLAEFALHTGDVAEPAVAAGNIFQRLVVGLFVFSRRTLHFGRYDVPTSFRSTCRSPRWTGRCRTRSRSSSSPRSSAS